MKSGSATHEGAESLEDLLSKRLKAHEENLKAHRALVDEQRKWLLGAGANGSTVNHQAVAPPPTAESQAVRPVAAPGVVDVPLALVAAVAAAPSASARDAVQPAASPAAAAATAATAKRASLTASAQERAQRRLADLELERAIQETHNPQISRNSLEIAERSLAHEEATGGDASPSRLPIEQRLMQREKERQRRLSELRRVDEEERLAREREAAAAVTAVSAKNRAASAKRSVRIVAEGDDYHHDREPQRAEMPHDRLSREAAAMRARHTARADVNREVADLREVAELQGTPRVSAASLRLAQRRRQKEGCEGLDIAESLLKRDEQSRAEKWLRIQQLAAAEVPARPVISKHAAELALRRSHELSSLNGAAAQQTVAVDVVDRLYRGTGGGASGHSLGTEVSARREDKLRELVAENLDCTFQPAITPRAHHLHRKEGHTVGDDLYDQAMLKFERQELRQQQKLLEEQRLAKTMAPKINPVSEIIVSKLAESTQERLNRPKRDAAAAAALAAATGAATHTSPRIDRRSRAMVARREAMLLQAQAISGGNSNSHQPPLRAQSASLSSARLRQRRIEELHNDAQRRQQRLLQERDETRHNETAGLSFQPAITQVAHEVAGATDFLERAEAWARKRQQRQATQRDEIERRELAECTFQPALAEDLAGASRRVDDSGDALRDEDGGDISLFSSSAHRQRHSGRAAAPPQQSSIYGGDGTAWGYHKHLERQTLARRKKEDDEAYKAKVFNTPTPSAAKATTSSAPLLGVTASQRKAQDRYEAAALSDAFVDQLLHADHHRAATPPASMSRRFSPPRSTPQEPPSSVPISDPRHLSGRSPWSPEPSSRMPMISPAGPPQATVPQVTPASVVTSTSAATSSALESARRALQKASALSAATIPL